MTKNFQDKVTGAFGGEASAHVASEPSASVPFVTGKEAKQRRRQAESGEVLNGSSVRPLYAHMSRHSPADEESSSIAIGSKIRHLRKSLKMTIDELASKTNMSSGYISQIERDISSPTLNSLQMIASALKVNVTHFFSEAEHSAEKYILRKEGRRFLSFAAGIRECQLNTSSVENLQVLYSIFEPGASVDEAYSHDGEECGLVLSGSFELSIDGETFHLREGDSFTFPSSKMHRYRNRGDKAAIIVWTMTPPSY